MEKTLAKNAIEENEFEEMIGKQVAMPKRTMHMVTATALDGAVGRTAADPRADFGAMWLLAITTPRLQKSDPGLSR